MSCASNSDFRRTTPESTSSRKHLLKCGFGLTPEVGTAVQGGRAALGVVRPTTPNPSNRIPQRSACHGTKARLASHNSEVGYSHEEAIPPAETIAFPTCSNDRRMGRDIIAAGGVA
jgi:hypothetical protein